MFLPLRALLRAIVVLSLLSIFPNSAMAQQRAGSLRGQVADELGALVVGATVTITGADGTQKNSVTAADGTYSFAGLPPGKYSVKVSAPGFSL